VSDLAAQPATPVRLDYDRIIATIDHAEVVSPAPPDAGDFGAFSHSGDGGVDGSGGGVGDAFERRLGGFPLTDLGNAERFVARFKSRFLWCPALGWLAWDGKRWNRDGAEGLVRQAEHETVRAIQDEADALRGTSADIVVGERKGEPVRLSDKISAWGRASEAAAKLAAVAKHAAPYLEVAPARLDADPMKLNVANGTLVLGRREGGDYVEFQPHDPADLITKIAPVDYDPEAVCPNYDAFLAFVQPEAPLRRFLHQWAGISATGDVGEQKLVFFWGKGKNGKSTLVDAWAHVLGEYGESVPIETFLDQGRGRNAGAATPDLAILPGVRFLRTSEPEKGAKLAEALIKLATGGEPLQVRHLNRDYFKFYPSFKLTMSGNYRPSIAGTDDGIWRRVLLVPWIVTVPEERRDRHLGAKLPWPPAFSTAC
jgi:putative DNA primase/helicase